MIPPYLLLVIAFLLNALGNILLKIGALGSVDVAVVGIRGIVTNWPLMLGVVFFATNVLFYVLALRSLPLSVAYPVMVGMGFLIVNAYAAYWLGESVSPLQLLGYVALVAGVLAVVLGR